MNIEKNKFTFDLQRFDSAFSGGDGSHDNPYQIKTVADLQQLSTDVKNGNTYEEKYFKLMANRRILTWATSRTSRPSVAKTRQLSRAPSTATTPTTQPAT